MPGYDPLDSASDLFRPPATSTMVGCLHCQEVYDSYLIEWRVETGKQHGFWWCPTEGCDGKGFGFDIFPIDPNYQDERICRIQDDDESDFDDDDYVGEETEPPDENGKDDGEAVPY
jgi:hypothetical protein